MRINIESPHIHLSEKITNIVRSKFDRFAKMHDRILLCDLVLKKEKNSRQNSFVVEAKISIPGNDLYASENASSFELAAEKVCVDLENKIRKQKEKINKKIVKSVDKFIVDEEETVDEEISEENIE